MIKNSPIVNAIIGQLEICCHVLDAISGIAKNHLSKYVSNNNNA